MLLRSLVILLFSMLAVYSCDAPRLNPLDPRNPDYVKPINSPNYSITGSIKITSSPLEPVVNADIYWANEKKVVRSDQSGNFTLENLKPEDGWLYFEKSGYVADSSFVEWEGDTVKVVDKLLQLIQEASITGNVRTQASPSAPVVGVNVYWRNEHRLMQTDQSGNFTFNNVTQEDGWLFFEKDGYFKDSIQVVWNNNATINVQRFLVYIPTATYFSIYTEVENGYDKNIYKIGFETEIIDKDNIVDSVIIQNQELKIYQVLKRQEFNKYGDIFKIGIWGLSSIEAAAGREFKLIFIDNDNQRERIIATKEKINRVINQEITLIKPVVNTDTVSSTPKLEWNRFQPGFYFHYLVEVLTNEQPPEPVYQKDSISLEDKELSVDVPINNEETGVNAYYWVIWCVDEFNNKSRSKPGSFIVK